MRHRGPVHQSPLPFTNDGFQCDSLIAFGGRRRERRPVHHISVAGRRLLAPISLNCGAASRLSFTRSSAEYTRRPFPPIPAPRSNLSSRAKEDVRAATSPRLNKAIEKTAASLPGTSGREGVVRVRVNTHAVLHRRLGKVRQQRRLPLR